MRFGDTLAILDVVLGDLSSPLVPSQGGRVMVQPSYWTMREKHASETLINEKGSEVLRCRCLTDERSRVRSIF